MAHQYWCIMKHIKGDSYEHDCYILDAKYRIKKFMYKESAEYQCAVLNSERGNDESYYVVRW